MNYPGYLVSKQFSLSAIILAALTTVSCAQIDQPQVNQPQAKAELKPLFQRIAQFPVYLNNDDKEQETSAEIIAAYNNGNALVYSNSPNDSLGFIDITDAANPQPAGEIKLEGEPTSVTTYTSYAYAAVNTSKSYTEPSGVLNQIDLNSKQVITTCEINGQPDSVAISKDASLLAVAIENERDEDLNDGEIPQMPAGSVLIAYLTDGQLDCNALHYVDISGLADIAGSDPEPEFVDFNDLNELVISLQENNHIVVLHNLADKDNIQVSDFFAGSVTLTSVDTKDDGQIRFSETIENALREPDAVKWIDDNYFATANEGDYEGGSRSFSIFHKSGQVVFDSGSELDHVAAAFGQYPDKRSDNKGSEPEGLAVGEFNGETYIFVNLERSHMVAVYRFAGANTALSTVLFSGMAPEGSVTIPERGLFVTANEDDEPEAYRAHVNIYQWLPAEAAGETQKLADIYAGDYQLTWGALSGAVEKDGFIYTVSDSFYSAQPAIYKVKDGVIAEKIIVKSETALDLEGITTDNDGHFWLVSEGRPADEEKQKEAMPNMVLKVDAEGNVLQTVTLPEAQLDGMTRFGFEGIAYDGENNRLWVAQQRPWNETDSEKHVAPMYVIDAESGAYLGQVKYPLESVETGWVGLADLSFNQGTLYVLERDNQMEDKAQIKRVYAVNIDDDIDLSGNTVVSKTLVADLIPYFYQQGITVPEKIESLMVDAAGKRLFIATDNDGIDDNPGETLFRWIEY